MLWGGDGDEMDGGCAYTVVVCAHVHKCTHIQTLTICCFL